MQIDYRKRPYRIELNHPRREPQAPIVPLPQRDPATGSWLLTRRGQSVRIA